jgi:hypothetical protein
MRLKLFFFLLVMPLLAEAPGYADAKTADDSVLVVGALHDLHDREPAFGYDRLRAAILAFAPDILVLEVRPDELAERKPTPGRPEYPTVIWPLIVQMRVEAVAIEPGGETFKKITGQAGAAFDKLKKQNPEGAAALSRFDTATEEVLLNYWRNAAQVQDETTVSLASGLLAAQFALAGQDFVAAQSRWDGHMSDKVLQTVRANPGKRIMVIGSYKNREMLNRAVREVAPTRVIVASEWFEHLGLRVAR